MKEIGRTPCGAYLVEMSTVEHRQLTELDSVANLLSPEYYSPGLCGERVLDSDMENALAAIVQWMALKRNLNNLRKHLSKMEQLLGKDKEVPQSKPIDK